MKRCWRCGETKPLTSYHVCRNRKDGRQSTCKPCTAEMRKNYNSTLDRKRETARQAEWKLRNPAKVRAQQRRADLRKNFGLESYEYDAMSIAQSGLCAICGGPPGKRRLAVDHNHETGKVRQLLCQLCNQALGHMKDNPELLRAAARYLERHTD